MKLETDLPYEYEGNVLYLPPFDKNGRITKRVRHSLGNALYLYSGLARHYAQDHDNNPSNFKVNEVYLVGSGSRENRFDSDMDYLLICRDIDVKSGQDIKLLMSFVLFCDRPKQEAVDVYVRPFDAYPERGSTDITDQVRKMIDENNSVLE